MAWRDLSIAQRSQLMNLYRRNGITDLSAMRQNYDLFSSSLQEESPMIGNPAAPIYAGGGNKFETGGPSTYIPIDKYSLLYNPPEPSVPNVRTPLRYEPQPHYGLYEYPSSKGMLADYPITIPRPFIQTAQTLPAFNAASTTTKLDPIADAARRIKAVENSKNNKSGGWDATTGRWYPHKSYEGGADTIAYGIKLTNGTPEAALALRQGYLTDAQAEQALDSLARKYYDAAKKVYDEKYGKGEWDKLSDKSQSILVDYSYNPGLAKFPKLMEGFHSGNMDLIRNNYKRFSNGKPLGRNQVLLDEIDTLGTQYPIFRANGGPIHIKKENRGKFNATKKRTGKTTEELTHSKNPLTRKRAIFAQNAKKWKHEFGGVKF